MSNINAIQYHLIKDNEEQQYDNCYDTGIYEDYNCEGCPHKYECSGYEGDDD